MPPAASRGTGRRVSTYDTSLAADLSAGYLGYLGSGPIVTNEESTPSSSRVLGPDMVRVSIGVEHYEDILADIQRTRPDIALMPPLDYTR